jgi:rRNA biogenesis protein RRP5
MQILTGQTLNPGLFGLPVTMPSLTLGKKRPSESIVQNGVKPKKIKFGDDGEAKTVAPAPTIFAPDEIDFPRGGGSSFTPLEQKTIRAEAIKEADAEIFKVG